MTTKTTCKALHYRRPSINHTKKATSNCATEEGGGGGGGGGGGSRIVMRYRGGASKAARARQRGTWEKGGAGVSVMERGHPFD